MHRCQNWCRRIDFPEGVDPLHPSIIALADREALVEKEQVLVEGVASEFLAWLAEV
jgi:hypothetical protein